MLMATNTRRIRTYTAPFQSRRYFIMWSEMKGLQRRFALQRVKPSLSATMVLAAATAAATTFVVLQESNNPEDKITATSNPRRFRVGISQNQPISYSITHCDSSTFMEAPSPRAPTAAPMGLRLRRQATIQKLDETAVQDRLESRYDVHWQQAPLGEGAFGVVWAATDRTTGERVAVKKIPKHCTDMASFQREMDALLLLREHGGHPHTANLRANYDEHGAYYLVMDLVAGRELFEQLCDKGPYSEADAAVHIREVASALAFLHGVGIVHADLKPENIMLSSKQEQDAVVKLVDFGCAHLVANAPWLDHQPKGTPRTIAYCPPEVIRETTRHRHGQHQDGHPTVLPSWDMWSLGCVIYTMLVGAHPFDLEADATDEQLEERILSGHKPPLRGTELTSHLSDDAIALIEGLLDPDVNKRWNAEQVLNNPWVRGERASSSKIEGSDRRLAKLSEYKTFLGSTFFKALLLQSDAVQSSSTSNRQSLLEAAFRRLDHENRGFLTKKDIHVGTSSETGEEVTGQSGMSADESEDKLSLSDVSALLADNMKNCYFPRGHRIYKEGDPGEAMYLLDSGTVECTTSGGFRKIRKSGELLGVGSLMASDEKVHHSTAVCLTPVQAIEIKRELFDHYLAADTETFLSMVETDRYRRRERVSSMLQVRREQGRTHTLNQGKVLFREGEMGDSLYILDKGEIRISVQGNLVRTLQPGEVMGEHAAFHGRPYNVTAECTSKDCRVLALPYKAMHELFESDPSLRRDFRDLVLRRNFKKALCAETKRPFPRTPEEIRAAFEKIDVDRSGAIDFEELRAMVLRFDPYCSEEDIHDMLASLDLNKSGSLTWNEFDRIFSMDKEA